MNGKYYIPTHVLMGPGCVTNNKELFKTLGSKAMIVTGANSAKINGSEKDVTNALNAVGIPYLVYDKVMSNPTIACAYDGAKTARDSGADFIIAIGGGSPMDAGKAIALLAAQDIPEENLFLGNYGYKALPMAFIPTTAGTGSEVTQYSILTNDKAKTKMSIASDLLFPQYAFVDTRYTENLTLTTTVNTAIDALSHGIEGILSIRASVLSNALAKESIGLIMSCIPELQNALDKGSQNTINGMAREQLMYASLLAGMVIAQTGTTVVHAMGYSLTYFKNIDHGRANGLLLAEYLLLVEKEKPELISRILKAMHLRTVDQLKTLLNRLLGDKETLTADEIQQFSALAIQTRNIINSAVKPSENDIREMYAASLNS